MSKTLLLFLLLGSLIGLPVRAQHVDGETARQRALAFLERMRTEETPQFDGAEPRRAKGVVQPVPSLALVDLDPVIGLPASDALYLFNVGSDEGFVLLAADDRVPMVLGYADEGRVDAATIPVAMQTWLQGYVQAIRALGQSADASGGAPIPSSGKLSIAPTSAYNSSIPPLLQCSWSQTAPYSLLCPSVGGSLCPTGCVATAMAQILTVVRPDGCTALDGYTTGHLGIQLPSLPATTFQWELMQPQYEAACTDASAQEVARLMRYCGQSVRMDYTTVESASTSGLAAEALRHHFGMASSCQVASRASFSSQAWHHLIYTELANGRPVLMSGGNAPGERHAFVCDGYKADGDLFHINWGWGGGCNGYFYLNDLYPSIRQSVEGYAGYNIACDAVVGIRQGSSVEAKVRNLRAMRIEKFTEQATRPSLQSPFGMLVSVTFYNGNEGLSHFQLCWGAYDEHDNLVQLSESVDVFCKYHQDRTVSMPFRWDADCPDGVYYLKPLSRQKGEDAWALCDNYNACTLVATVAGLQATLAHERYGTYMSYQATDLQLSGSLLVDERQELRFMLTNMGDYYSGLLHLLVDDALYDILPVDVDPGTTSQLRAAVTFHAEGQHTLQLAYPTQRPDSLGYASDPITVTIQAAGSSTAIPSVTVSAHPSSSPLYYNLQGQALDPRRHPRGIVLVRRADGTTRKILYGSLNR